MPAPSPAAAVAAAATLARSLLAVYVVTTAPPGATALALSLLLALTESATAALTLYWSSRTTNTNTNNDPTLSWAHALVPGSLLATALATGHAALQAVPPTLVLAVHVLVAAVVSSAILPAVRSRRGLTGGGVPPRLVPVIGTISLGVLVLVVVYARVLAWVPAGATLGTFVLSACGFAMVPSAELVSVKTLSVTFILLLVASVPAGLLSTLVYAHWPLLPFANLLAFTLASAAAILSLSHSSNSSSTSGKRGAASGESAAFLLASLFALALWSRSIPGDALTTSPVLSVLGFALVYGASGFLAYLHYRASSTAGAPTTTVGRYEGVNEASDDELEHIHTLGQPALTCSTTTVSKLVLVSLVGYLLAFALVQLFITTPSVHLVDPCASLLFHQLHPSHASPRNQKVLITGGAGFIGSHLATALVALGYSVRMLDDFSSGKFNNIAHLVGNPRFEVSVGDVGNATQVKSAIAGVEYVYHLAAAAAAPLKMDPRAAKRVLEVNAFGTINVLKASRAEGGVRKVVYAGSAGYYGGGRGVVGEDGMRMGVVGVDASSKFEGEIQMDIYDRIFNLSTTSLRLFHVYGPRQPASGLVGIFLDQVKRNTSLTIPGDESQLVDLVHVDDAVSALVLAQQLPGFRNQVINVGSGMGRSVQSIADLLGKRQIHVPASAGDFAFDTIADTCKAKRMLGFAATRDFESSVRSLLADTLNPTRLTAQPAFQQLARNLTSTPWLLPSSSLAHVYRPGLYNLTRAAQLATHPPTFLHAPTNSSSKHLLVIPYFKHIRPLALHTYYTARALGHVAHILLVAENTAAARDCLTLNLACFNAEGTPLLSIVSRLARDGFMVHVSRPGAAYVRDVWESVGELLQRTGAGMLVPAGWTPEARGGGYVVTPAASKLMQAIADADEDEDDGALNVAFGKQVHYCMTRDECTAAAKDKEAVVQFKAAYECLPTAGGGSVLDEVCDGFAGGHVLFYDAACVREDEEVERAMRRAGVWWMVEAACSREQGGGCVGVPKRMVGLDEPGSRNECLGGVAKMVAVAN